MYYPGQGHPLRRTAGIDGAVNLELILALKVHDAVDHGITVTVDETRGRFRCVAGGLQGCINTVFVVFFVFPVGGKQEHIFEIVWSVYGPS